MKSMEQMQKEQLDKCSQTEDGWPRPFVHFGGAIEVCRDQKQWDKAFRTELIGFAIAVPAALILFACLVVVVEWVI